MHGAGGQLTRRAWLRIYRGTGLLSAISVILSIVITNVIMETYSAGINVQGLIVAMVMPLLLGTPALAVILFKQEQLRAANERLQVLATTDWLTRFLNRGAFTARVVAELDRPGAEGALLVVDVDHFKAINDRYGHDRGDAALRLIAETLRGAVTGKALFGRLGGEEFGIFLHGADASATASQAENLRQAVGNLAFVADGEHCPLSISVGGAAFVGATRFRDLYRQADTCLYRAKAAGRDSVSVAAAA